MSRLSDGSLADLLAFEAWPEEMQRIARAAVRDEIEEEEKQADLDEQYDWSDGQWRFARQHVAIVVKKLQEGKALLEPVSHLAGAIDDADASLTTAIEMLEALPEEFADLTDPDAP